ncbi:hypothetical protein ACPA1T_00770 [Bacillus amyloliquefaciens]|uniref:hypothetical protein n=1 Tax=Bacillus amyloliquefaciens TaxID=1390 RepID=UPI003C730602
MVCVLFLSSLVIIFNIWYVIICAFTPEYYQNTNLTSDETKFIKHMPINQTDNAGSMYGVDVSKSVGGLTTLTFGTLDKKGTFFQLRHDDDWVFNSTDLSHYFWTAAGYNALIFILVFVIVKQMNNVLI